MKKQKQKSPAAPAQSFEHLVSAIQQAHTELAAQAARAVNTSLTLRNWLIGYHIAEYEQQGADRAEYGDQLIEQLATRLRQSGVSGTDARALWRYRKFYLTYPEILVTVSPELASVLALPTKIGLIRESVTPKLGLPPDAILNKLSFSHIAELLECEDATKRAFYEVECVRGHWSLRELRRQIGSLYYERTALSTNKKKMTALTQAGAERASQTVPVRDPYVFEFLGLKSQEVMGESQVEDRLLDKLQEFMLELGHGFCFEARQKRILIGDTTNFVDLVFYHRVLKCHVLVELKTTAFSHENIGQLNTYVTWYRRHMMTAGDNPPVGMLLCTEKDHALVEYALAGIDNAVFVSKYLLELPQREAIQRFIEAELTASEG